MDELTPQLIYDKMYRFGTENSDPVRVEKYARYFKEGYDAFGLNEGLLDQKVREFLESPGINLEMVCQASHLLVQSPKYEMAACAFKLLLAFKKDWDKSVFTTIEKWFPVGITNWAHTDYICGELMSLLFKKRIIETDDLLHWRESEYRFQRRAAVVSLIKPMKTDGNFDKYFTFIEPMMHDKERVVHQALGWLLREMWKKQSEPTESFLFRFKNTAPRLIFQYATEKMSKEGKERFRKNSPATPF